jgi:phosphatidylinositol alpha-1,6-mannosyltransferase
MNYVIVGQGASKKYTESLRALARKLGIENRVHFLDTVFDRTELYASYREADLFCLFSQNDFHDVEGFGIVFLEAAAFGLPVVGTGNCGIDDAMEDGVNGILIKTNEPKDFSDAILKILNDENLKESMKMKSLELANKSDWSDRTEKYVTLYNSIGIHGA